MKTGKHYFSLLTEEEQRNFKQACDTNKSYVPFRVIMEKKYEDFESFIDDINWWESIEGFGYWSDVATSERAEQPIEFKAYNPNNGLVTFKHIFVFTMISIVALSLLLIAYKVGYDNGHNTGYQHGIEKVDSIVNYEELTPESVEAVQSMQLNTTRINENRPKR